MKQRKILLLFLFCITFDNVFPKGFYESHKKKGNWSFHAETYWDTQFPKVFDITEEMIKRGHENKLSSIIDNLIISNSSLNSNTTYDTCVILKDGLCYEIMSFTGKYVGGCSGYVQVYKYYLSKENPDVIPTLIWEKQFNENGANYFNDIYQLYENKVNEYLKKIK